MTDREPYEAALASRVEFAGGKPRKPAPPTPTWTPDPPRAEGWYAAYEPTNGVVFAVHWLRVTREGQPVRWSARTEWGAIDGVETHYWLWHPTPLELPEGPE